MNKGYFLLIFFLISISCSDEVNTISRSKQEQLDLDKKRIEGYLNENNLTGFTSLDNGLHYKILDQGNSEFPSIGDTLSVDYIGQLLNGGCLPDVQVLDIALQENGVLLAATWGRGIWEAAPKRCPETDRVLSGTVSSNFNAKNSFTLQSTQHLTGDNKVVYEATETITLNEGFEVSPGPSYEKENFKAILFEPYCENCNGVQLKFATPTSSDNMANELLEQKLQSESIKLFPNPNEGVFHIAYLGNNENPSTTIQVYGMDGSVVKKLSLDNFENEINMSDLSSGVYLLKVKINDDVAVRKMVIEH